MRFEKELVIVCGWVRCWLCMCARVCVCVCIFTDTDADTYVQVHTHTQTRIEGTVKAIRVKIAHSLDARAGRTAEVKRKWHFEPKVARRKEK